MGMRTVFALMALVTAGVAIAKEGTGKVPSAAPEFFSGGYLIQVMLSLVAVIGLMLAVLWLLRRANGVGRGFGSHLQVLASVGLGQREKAVLVRAGDTQLLLGVAPGYVRTLHVFDEPVVDVGPEDGLPDDREFRFSEVWKQAVGRDGSGS